MGKAESVGKCAGCGRNILKGRRIYMVYASPVRAVEEEMSYQDARNLHEEHLFHAGCYRRLMSRLRKERG